MRRIDRYIDRVDTRDIIEVIAEFSVFIKEVTIDAFCPANLETKKKKRKEFDDRSSRVVTSSIVTPHN